MLERFPQTSESKLSQRKGVYGWESHLTWSVHLVVTLLLTDGAITLLQPAGVEKPNAHVFLHFAGRDLLPRDGGHKIFIWSWGWRQRFRG